MPIRYVPEGTATTTGRLAIAAGKAAEKVRAAEMQAAADRQAAQIRAQQQAQAAAQAAEMAQTQMRLQAQVADQELRIRMEAQSHAEDVMLKQQMESAAKQWELQKITLASQHDFELQEKALDMKAQYDLSKELQAKAKFDQQMEALEKSDMFAPGAEKEAAKKQLWAEYNGLRLATAPKAVDPNIERRKLQTEVTQGVNYVSQFVKPKDPTGVTYFQSGSNRRPATEAEKALLAYQEKETAAKLQRLQTYEQTGGSVNQAAFTPSAPNTAPSVQHRTIRNSTTGAERNVISMDGGLTWQAE